MNRTRTRRVARVTASVLAVLALAACGGDDDDDTAETTDASTEATEVTTDARDDTDTDDTDDTDTDTDDTDDIDTDDSAPVATTESTGGGTAPEDEYVAAAAEAIGFADADISECMAGALVDGIGMDRIEASGLSPQEFVDSPSLAEIDLAVEAADAPDVQAEMADCGDLVEAYLESSDVTEQEAVCARAELTNDLLAEWLVTGISELPTSPEVDAMVEALGACDTD